MEFVYKLRDQQGKIQEATARADSASVLRARLKARGIDVLEIRERTTSSDMLARLSSSSLADIMQSGLFEFISLKDMVVFSRQFAAMISSGVAMLRTLTIIVEQCPNRKLKRALDDVRLSIESGISLSDALA